MKQLIGVIFLILFCTVVGTKISESVLKEYSPELLQAIHEDAEAREQFLILSNK